MIYKDHIFNVKDKKLNLRSPELNDAELLLNYLKITCKETRFLVKEPEEIQFTVEDEKKYIENSIYSKTSVDLLGFIDGEHVGNCSLRGFYESRMKHRVSLGIALYQKYTNMGIGRVMIEELINIAKDCGFEQIELEVNVDNKNAIHLYESMGFKIYGTFPNNLKFKDGSYIDVYWMMKKL